MASSPSPDDWKHLHRAVELGRRGWGRVHPNPMVGCVLVAGGKVVGEGWHEEAGHPHAEVAALLQAGEKARGATAFVSLEPCSHFGRTPPCTSALMDAGVSRVVYGAADPGGESGGGGDLLRRNGLEVLGSLFSREQSRSENPAFFYNMERQRPYVAIKLAQTLDGRISGARGERTPISGPEVRVETHRLRAGFSGILIGSETALVDDPLLTVREDVPLREQPTRLILDSAGRIPPSAKVFLGVREAPVVVFTREETPGEWVRGLEGAGASVHRIPEGLGGLSLEAVMDVCWEKGIRSLFCEGGGRLASQLISQGIARRLYLFVAPFVLGDEGVPAFPGLAAGEPWEAWQPVSSPSMFGRDQLLVFDRTD